MVRKKYCQTSLSLSFEGYPLQVRHKQDWGRGFIPLLPQTAALPESDAGSDVIKPASNFVIQNRQTSCSMWCPMYKARFSTWSAVCSGTPHSQFGEGSRPHLCMDEWNRPTPVRRRLSLTQAARGKPIPTGLAPVSGTKARSLEAFSQYSVFHFLVCPFRGADAKSGNVVQEIPRTWHKRVSGS